MDTETPTYHDAEAPIDLRVDDLLRRMTLEEKVDQLHQSGIGDTNPNNLAARADEFRPTYGSYILGGSPTVLETRNAIQRRAVEESRLGIPAIFAADVIHGYRAIVPIPLAQACSWDPELVARASAMAAEESRAHGIDWTFAPMVDRCVDARWGRIAETFGESPYASAVFAAAAVRGYQGDVLGAPGSVAACLKHYVGYGASEGGRDYSYTSVPMQELWDMHLPAFEAGVRAGARSVMSAFNDLNGVPTSANRYTLTEILKERWRFGGVVVSDWNSVLQLMHQGFAATEAEAARKAINAGVDVNMADGLYRKHLPALVASGEVPIAAVDEAVRRLLRLKFEMGLFERPYAERSPLTGAPPNQRQLQLAEELAGRSMVLLKNEGVLPLAREVKRIALIGPLAVDRGALLGSWAQQGMPEETQNIREALQERLPEGVELAFEEGCSVEETDARGISAAVALAERSDVVVLCLGERQWMSGENASRSTLRLGGGQEELAVALAGTGRPIVLVLVSGRPLEVNTFEPGMRAILAAWQGGSRAAAAVADIILGRVNPSGKLSVTWPRSTGQIPIYHNMRPRGRLGDEGAYRDFPVSPQHPFGHGLSYTTFEYGEIRLQPGTISSADEAIAEVEITNSGEREGTETVLWFIRDPAASITRPEKELKHFERVRLSPGERRKVRFSIVPARDLSFPDADGAPVLEPGEIVVMAGPRSARLTLQAR